MSTIFLQWEVERDLHHLHIGPDKPWQNGINESFNGNIIRRFKHEVQHGLKIA